MNLNQVIRVAFAVLGLVIWTGSRDLAAQDAATQNTGAQDAFREHFREAASRPAGDFGTLVQYAGEIFLGAPYEAGMLDRSDTEELVETLESFDCVLFVETALALAQGIAEGDSTRAGFRERLALLRYREGEPNGYCSRLHYFSEWISSNDTRGLVQNMTPKLGSEWEKPRSFMTENRSAYRLLASSDSLFTRMLEVESALGEQPMHLVARDRVADVLPGLQAGDIVAFATAIPGLDVTHTGLIWVGPGGRRGLLHASPRGGVQVSPDLQSYLQNNPSHLGILIARPLRPGASSSNY